MLSKCANPECSEVFRYLHQGKIFHLSPTPELQMTTAILSQALNERFWLCDQCSREITLTWGGKQVKLVPLPLKKPRVEAVAPPEPKNEAGKLRLRGRAASAGRDDV